MSVSTVLWSSTMKGNGLKVIHPPEAPVPTIVCGDSSYICRDGKILCIRFDRKPEPVEIKDIPEGVRGFLPLIQPS